MKGSLSEVPPKCKLVVIFCSINFGYLLYKNIINHVLNHSLFFSLPNVIIVLRLM